MKPCNVSPLIILIINSIISFLAAVTLAEDASHLGEVIGAYLTHIDQQASGLALCHAAAHNCTDDCVERPNVMANLTAQINATARHCEEYQPLLKQQLHDLQASELRYRLYWTRVSAAVQALQTIQSLARHEVSHSDGFRSHPLYSASNEHGELLNITQRLYPNVTNWTPWQAEVDTLQRQLDRCLTQNYFSRRQMLTLLFTKKQLVKELQAVVFYSLHTVKVSLKASSPKIYYPLELVYELEFYNNLAVGVNQVLTDTIAQFQGLQIQFCREY